jgi:hypothetical protein
MLKRYAAPERISWSGRAWEIRQALRQEIRRRGGSARLSDLLPPPRSEKKAHAVVAMSRRNRRGG